MDSAEADAAIRRLPRRLRSSPLVPGGGLQAHEGGVGHRGHTIGKHVNKTARELAQRFKDDPNLKWSSSFTDRGVAEAAIARSGQQPGRDPQVARPVVAHVPIRDRCRFGHRALDG